MTKPEQEKELSTSGIRRLACVTALGMTFTIASSSDAAFVKEDAIPWLKVEVVGAQAGPTGGQSISGTTFIQRLNTEGGVAPATGCALPTDIGHKAFMSYKADYFFYRR